MPGSLIKDIPVEYLMWFLAVTIAMGYSGLLYFHYRRGTLTWFDFPNAAFGGLLLFLGEAGLLYGHNNQIKQTTSYWCLINPLVSCH